MFRFGFTVNDGVFSVWNGQSPFQFSPARLSFTMQSNLALQAEVVPNPFSAVAGSYNGLFTEANRLQGGSGFFALTLTDQGAYSAYLLIGGRKTAFTGQFDTSGTATKKIAQAGANPLTVSMSLDLSGKSGLLTGQVTDGQWVADLSADRAVFSTRTNPATEYAGSFTLIIPGGAAGNNTLPGGYG